jgi:hypothetical protein
MNLPKYYTFKTMNEQQHRELQRQILAELRHVHEMIAYWNEQTTDASKGTIYQIKAQALAIAYRALRQTLLKEGRIAGVIQAPLGPTIECQGEPITRIEARMAKTFEQLN